jgi:hypothetical protein
VGPIRHESALDDVRDEVGIIGEAAHEMRLEAMFGPDAQHARVADAHLSRHQSYVQCVALAGRSFTVFSTT